MVANTKTNMVLAVGQSQQIQSESGKTYAKRSLFVDATTLDLCTRQRSQFKNKLLFGFMEKHASVLGSVHVGDVVTVSFDIQGNEYKDRTGQTQYSINIRPYGAEVGPKQQCAQQPQTTLDQPTSAGSPPSDMPF